METWKVLAVDKKAKISFRSENKTIEGVRLLLQGPEPKFGEDERFIGFPWHDQFISHDRMKQLGVEPRPGETIVLLFNRYGDIEKMNIVPANADAN